MKVFQKQSASNPPTKRQLDAVHQPHQDLLSRAIHNFVIRFFPKSDFHGLSSTSLPSLAPRQSSSSLVSTILSSYSSIGPFISRLVAQGTLTYPMFTITLQRDSVDIGGNIGIMSLGKLPAGVNNDSLTWVKVRGYTTAEGGMTAPPDSPGEVYPVAWEVPIDDVWLDGQVLPRSSLSAANISLSALIDTASISFHFFYLILKNIILCCRATPLSAVLQTSSNRYRGPLDPAATFPVPNLTI